MEEMTGFDSRFIYSETPTAHMHTLKIVILEVNEDLVPLTPEVFVEMLAERMDRMPGLRRRAIAIPYRLGQPVWIDDEDFDLSRHIHWRAAPAPGSLRELSDIAAEIAAIPLDTSRPLWNMTVVHGLERGRIAVVIKLHHAVADGGAAVAMLVNAFVADPDEAIIETAHPEPEPSRRQLFRVTARARAKQIRNLPLLARDTYAGMRAARLESREAAGSLAMPFTGPKTPLNVSLTPERTFAMVELPIGDLLAIKRSIGTTLNVVYMSVVAGGLRRYLDQMGALPDKSLVAGVPIGTKIDPTRLSGNHVDNMYVPLGTEIADPVVRLRTVDTAARVARSVRSALGYEMMERRAALTPLNLYPLGLRLWARTRLSNRVRPPINLVVSNVAGPREPLEADGSVITGLFSVGPILEGIGVNVTAWSYVDTLNVAVLGCPASLADPWALTAQFEAELDDLRERVSPAE